MATETNRKTTRVLLKCCRVHHGVSELFTSGERLMRHGLGHHIPREAGQGAGDLSGSSFVDVYGQKIRHPHEIKHKRRRRGIHSVERSTQRNCIAIKSRAACVEEMEWFLINVQRLLDEMDMDMLEFRLKVTVASVLVSWTRNEFIILVIS